MLNNGSNMVLSVLLRAVDGISSPVRRIQQRLSMFRRQAESIGRRVGFERLTRSLTNAGQATAHLYNQSRLVARRLVLIGTLGAGALLATVNATAQLGTQTANVADMLGINVEMLQAYRYHAEQAGLGATNFDTALRRMLRRTSEAAQGGGAAADALKELELSAEALQMRTPEQQLGIVADALTRVENQSDRLRLAFNLFDTDGAMMLNMLRDGAAGLEDMSMQARRLGHIMSEDDVRLAERFSANMVDMRKSLQGVRNIIGFALMPIFSDWMVQLTSLLIEHRPQIEAWATNFAENLPARLQQLRVEFYQLAETLDPLLGKALALADRFGVVNTAAAGLALVVGAPIIIPLLRFTVAIADLTYSVARFGAGLIWLATKAIGFVRKELRVLSLVFRLNPIGLLVTAIITGALLIRKYWEPISAFFRGVWTGIKSGLQPVISIFKDVGSEFSGLAQLLGPVGDAFGWVVDRVGDLVRWMGSLLTPVNMTDSSLEKVSATGERVGHVIGTVLSKAVQFFLLPLRLMNMAVETTISVFQRARTVLEAVFNWSPLEQIQSGIDAVTEWLGTIDWAAHGRAFMESLADGIKSAATAPYRAAQEALSRARNLLPFSDAREGPLSNLTASGHAIPTTIAEGIQSADSAPFNALQDVFSRVQGMLGGHTPSSGRDATEVSTPSGTSPTSMTSTDMSRSNRGGVHIERVQFSPRVTIQAGANADSQEIATLVEELMERWRNKDMWLSIQNVQENPA